MQQSLTLAVTEQHGVENAWFGLALSHTSDAQPFPGTMLLAASRTSFYSSPKFIFYLSISGTTF